MGACVHTSARLMALITFALYTTLVTYKWNQHGWHVSSCAEQLFQVNATDKQKHSLTGVGTNCNSLKVRERKRERWRLAKTTFLKLKQQQQQKCHSSVDKKCNNFHTYKCFPTKDKINYEGRLTWEVRMILINMCWMSCMNWQQPNAHWLLHADTSL